MKTNPVSHIPQSAAFNQQRENDCREQTESYSVIQLPLRRCPIPARAAVPCSLCGTGDIR